MMPNSIKIRTLRAQACQTADVGFNMPGVIARQNLKMDIREGPAQMGNSVKAYDMESNVYAVLSDKLGTGDQAATFKYDSKALTKLLGNDTQSPYLFSLRNQALGISLDQMIARRAAVFFDKYLHTEKLKEYMEEYLPNTVDGLNKLQEVIVNRFKAIDDAYQSDGITDVLKSTETRTEVPVTKTQTNSTPISMISSTFISAGPQEGDITTRVYDKDTENLLSKQVMPMTGTSPMVNTDQGWRRPNPGEKIESSTTETTAQSEQVSSVQSSAYSHPMLENQAQYQQALVTLYQQLLSTRSTQLRTPYLDKIFAMELAGIDADVQAIQVNYAHTYLTPPIDGVITAIYKDVGEPVEPGEPVLRIENDNFLYLVGHVLSRQPLRVGHQIKLSATLFENSNVQQPLAGRIISVRGHDRDSDEWEVIIEVKNPTDAQGEKIIPLNYQFDPHRDIMEFA